MALILNASAEEQHFKVHGNHFNLKPGQIKAFTDTIADFICMERGYLGLVGLPETYDDIAFRDSAEGKALLASKKEQGVNARCKYLREIVYNNQVSLKMDLEKANIKADPRVFASEGEVAAMEELVKYQKTQDDVDQVKVDRIKELEKKLAAGK
jgi:hypothetical protein